MKKNSHILATVLAVALGMLAWPIAGGETGKTNQADKLDELLQQRRDTLRTLVDIVTAEYRRGTTGFESVASAEDQLIVAELELAKTPKARIAILQRRAELMKGFFAIVDARFKRGQVNQAQVLVARAALLQSQIQLAQEAAGDNKSQDR